VNADPGPGRAAQRRRTRAAIVAATARLLSAGADPSMADIAAAADVSRRTIYTYFASLDQLLLDASLGALSSDVDAEIAAADAESGGQDGQGALDPLVRAERILGAICRSAADTLPLGRKLIKLTVDVPPADTGPKRGYRRVQWIEAVLAPWRETLAPDRFEALVSALAMVCGWEGFIVLTDIRGLDPTQAQKATVSTAMALIRVATEGEGTFSDF
jgi:AcrR family transcriptional regulator